jgi:hypothetical protein
MATLKPLVFFKKQRKNIGILMAGLVASAMTMGEVGIMKSESLFKIGDQNFVEVITENGAKVSFPRNFFESRRCVESPISVEQTEIRCKKGAEPVNSTVLTVGRSTGTANILGMKLPTLFERKTTIGGFVDGKEIPTKLYNSNNILRNLENIITLVSQTLFGSKSQIPFQARPSNLVENTQPAVVSQSPLKPVDLRSMPNPYFNSVSSSRAVARI